MRRPERGFEFEGHQLATSQRAFKRVIDVHGICLEKVKIRIGIICVQGGESKDLETGHDFDEFQLTVI